MNDERSDVESKTVPEVKATTSSTEQQNPIEGAIDQLSSPMLKLDIDCLEELFEWLSIVDLLALRPTCKRLKRAVDYFIRENYPTIRIGFGRITLSLYKDQFSKFHQLDAVSLKLIKQISICTNELKSKEINLFKGILNQIERLHFYIDRLDGDFYDIILKWCTNLKYLSIANICGDKIIDTGNRWLYRNYPTIEHIVLDDSDIGGPGNGYEIIELKQFFEFNPNIQTFSTTFHFLWENRGCWIESSIKIDRLDVKGDCFLEYGMNRICGLLNKLHELGFYQRLHMYPVYIDNQTDIDQIASVKGLEKLYLSGVYTEIILPLMRDLREFCIRSERDFDMIGNVFESIVNIERVFFAETSSKLIVDSICHLAKVKEIKIDNLKGGDYFEENVLDVNALNKMRKQLDGACKTTIYVPEAVFLATKWTKTKTQFELIEIKRAEEVEWSHQFG